MALEISARLFRHRNLVRILLIRDMRAKYVGSAMGIFWAVISPLLLVLLYTYVFAVILKARVGANGSTVSYVFYLLSGMLPWIAIQESLSRSTTSIVDNAHLLKNFPFPSKIFPFYLSLSALVNQMIGMAILIVCISFFGVSVSPVLLVLPLLILLQFIFMVGLSWLTAAVHVFFRDTGPVLGVFLVIWMFLTPIFYLESQVPEEFHALLRLNPLNHLVRAYRAILLEGKMPEFPDVLRFGVSALCALFFGYCVFERKQPHFVDNV